MQGAQGHAFGVDHGGGQGDLAHDEIIDHHGIAALAHLPEFRLDGLGRGQRPGRAGWQVADGRNVARPAEAAAAYAREIARYREMIRVTGYVQAD
ncbi:Uncharacterised protein [Delftia tsuruhatensis]|uniref:hypothetical protein n=1 Tax=Delftia tsuruhatensis TaxID=180282 RepID=UPI001E76AAB9|nr:Uncharacterised protein [Delftia tsuruhatensis]CAC9677336.1 Uncharacterised protein [Delftia tsuruhatensis]